MALMSMTGYGRGEASSGDVRVEVELSAVNRKQFDLRLNLPRSLVALEAQVAKMVRSKITRGSVNGQVRITLSGRARCGGLSVDMDVAGAYVKALRKAGDKLGLHDDLGMEILMRLPDVVKFEDMTQNSQKVWPVLKKALQEALTKLLEMRRQEGAALSADIKRRFAKLEKRVGQIERLAPTVPKRHRTVLLERINNAGLSLGADDERIAREVALFADRCDISEELVRLHSHFAQVQKLMDDKAPAGRAFDFLCQEFLREINTIGSKANDARLSRHVIVFKTELECIREQVQNVE